ncbi:MAG: hypothetical protein BWK73_37905 [Thiothrix lacustris]|uniref:DUF4388 domain-containing protein n=1 Tax=Thiothrix lacustris TaxID=525917 RepID=A0A1Y1QF78_9GAMM|nr:MAG: hypothetical protein BWK73_37905 [Thiothrix lacustris]
MGVSQSLHTVFTTLTHSHTYDGRHLKPAEACHAGSQLISPDEPTMSNNAYYPYPTLWNGLIEVVAQQLSGTLLIATHDNASCRFALAKGRLTHCSFSRLHGEDALIAFTTIQAGRYSFNQQTYPFRSAAVVAHERAVELLGLFSEPEAKPLTPTELKPVSGSLFTKEEMETLFGKFYFE